MAKTIVLRDVPPDHVDEVVSEFEADGATVSKTQQADGNYTVTATYPDDSKLALVQRHGVVEYALATYRGRKKNR